MGKGRCNDLTGKRFDFLKVIKRAPNHITSGGNSLVAWECECDCGRRRIVPATNLRAGNIRSCGKCGRTVSHSLEDLTGQEFGFLTVIERAPDHVSSGGNTFVAWKCVCDCGREKIVTAGHLKSHHTQSCGKCGKFDRSVDFTGRHIGRLTVIEKADEWYTYPNGDRDFKWLCECDCGNRVVTRGNVLRNKRFVQSCGCWRKEESIKDSDMVDRDFGYCHVISRAERIRVSLTNTVDAWNCVCRKCGNHFVAKGPQLRFGKVVSCGCLSTSRWETWMIQYLDKHGYVYETQKYYDDLYGLGGGHLTYDFCVNLGKIIVLIECNGKQHYQPVSYFGGKGTFDRQLVHDARKREYAIERGIPLIELDCSCNMTMNEYFDLISIEFSKYV